MHGRTYDIRYTTFQTSILLEQDRTIVLMENNVLQPFL